MQTISFSSHKGGAGKTTALMTLASALAHRKKRVALFETDDNGPLGEWREYGREQAAWDDEACRIYQAHDHDELAVAYEAAVSDGMEYALVDTRGGGSDFNQFVMLNSNLIIVPTGLSVMEIDDALKGLTFAGELLDGAQADVPIGLLLNRTPTTRKGFSTIYKGSLKVIEDLPVFACRLGRRGAFEDIKASGLIHLYRERLLENPAKRLLVRNLEDAITEADALGDELIATLQAEEAA